MLLIEKMLMGELPMKEFARILNTDINVQSELNSIIPEDAKWNEDHPLWEYIAFTFLLEYDFDLYRGIVSRHKFDNSISDNLNIWGTIHAIYMYIKPDLLYTTKYHDDFGLYLDVVKDIYDGPEVRSVLEGIFTDAFKEKSKTARKKKAKAAILEAFHVEDKNRPYWIQGAEWPMGENSPMKYISKKREGEVVKYTFIDVDTGELRVVEQYY